MDFDNLPVSTRQSWNTPQMNCSGTFNQLLKSYCEVIYNSVYDNITSTAEAWLLSSQNYTQYAKLWNSTEMNCSQWYTVEWNDPRLECKAIVDTYDAVSFSM